MRHIYLCDWQDFFLSGEGWGFLPEVMLRSFIAFAVVLLALKLTGKKGVRQLTLFELVIILTLGSAAGDMSFYKEVGVLPAVLTIVCIIILYKLITWLIVRSSRLERFMEGEPVVIIEQGRYTQKAIEEEHISFDEFFMELRQAGVEHLGQVRYAILEVNGQLSVFKNAEKDVRPGLRILPQYLGKHYTSNFPEDGWYGCVSCGTTIYAHGGTAPACPDCGHTRWSAGSGGTTEAAP
ncbi:DUF421 domain-containing protein [Niabella terrae]